MTEAELNQRTRETAVKLFHTLEGGAGLPTWTRFDEQLLCGGTRQEVAGS